MCIIMAEDNLDNVWIRQRIESVWAEIQSLFKKIYSTIKETNFLYFLKEIEYSRCIKSLNDIHKLEDFAQILACVDNGINQELLTEDDLMDLDFDTIIDD